VPPLRPSSVGTTSRRAQPPRRRTRAHLAKRAWGFLLSLCTRARCCCAIRPTMLIHADVLGRVADQARQARCSCARARRRRLVLLGADAAQLWRVVRALVDHARGPGSTSTSTRCRSAALPPSGAPLPRTQQDGARPCSPTCRAHPAPPRRTPTAGRQGGSAPIDGSSSRRRPA